MLYFIILVIYVQYKDRRALANSEVTPLLNNYKLDHYFYEILFFTEHRRDADTKSRVQFILTEDHGETFVRTLSVPHRSILQHGGIDAFVIDVPK